MSILYGVIYLRDNYWYRSEDVIKLGISTSLKNRDSVYNTGEVTRGNYIMIIEIPHIKINIIDKLLKYHLKKYNIYKGGGTEFYDRQIYHLIEPFLQNINVEYRILSIDEIFIIENNERMNQIKNIVKIKNFINNLNVKNIIENYKIKKIINSIKPKTHQIEILKIIKDFYALNNIGKLIWSCGLGKALMSIFIAKYLNYKTVLFGVPSNNLQNQIKNEIHKVYLDKVDILFIGGENSVTDIDKIKLFLTESNNNKFVITTYHSCYLLNNDNIMFDFKIGDEAHHLVGVDNNSKNFKLFHKIKSSKSLFMTATEKISIDKIKYSMDDETIFGKYIDVKTVYWSIENKKITDYNIVLIKNTLDEIDDIIDNLNIDILNKEIFISSYMCLKSFEKYSDLTHILLYTNNTEDADLAKKYIDEISNLDGNLYNKALYSKNCRNIKTEVDKFKDSLYGIIPCVYIFGEGFDLPKLNGVCIAGNMQSEIRIIQYLLRPNRLEESNPNKKAYIIIPYIDDPESNTNNKSFDKVRHIISQMRNVDEKIEQKITCLTNNQKKKKKNSKCFIDDIQINDDNDELEKIKIRLRYSKSLNSTNSEEQDEYDYVRSINISLNISSQKEYNENKNNHIHYINDPEKYFKLNGVWLNWYHFFGYDTLNFIQQKDEWIKFCKEKQILSIDDYYKQCEIYNQLPKEPANFYNNFSNILNELNLNNRR
jgi:superfamily II DNA or RNA helicase